MKAHQTIRQSSQATFQKYSLIFKKPAGTSRGYLYQQANYFVRLRERAHSTVFGLGEAGPLVGLSSDDRPDFADTIADVCAKINRGTPLSELNLSAFPALVFALEMAQLDLENNGQRRLFDTPFSRGETGLPIHGLIWMADAVGVRKQIEQKVNQGYRCIKLKVGALDFAQECDLLHTIRQQYPADQIEIRLDANGAFSPDTALETLKRLAEFEIFALEQPIKWGQWSTLGKLCQQSPIPIALDEELIGVYTRVDKLKLLQTIQPAYLVLKPTLIGGFAAAEEWITLAESQGVGWWINSALESTVGLNALAQWTSGLGSNLAQGLGTGQLYTNNFDSPLYLADAGLKLDPKKPWRLAEVLPNA